ncbi:spore coat protein [Natronospora cellulosivora (SeqCode)]
MLQDNQIALDCLMSSKMSIIELTRAANEASSPQIRQKLIQMRNQAEQDHQEIYHIAERTGGYIAAGPASNQEKNRVNSFIQQKQQRANQMQEQEYRQGQYSYQMPGGQYMQSHNNQGANYYENVNPLQGQSRKQFTSY